MSTLRSVSVLLLVNSLVLSLASAQASNPGDLSRIAGWPGVAPNAADSFTFVVVSDRTGGHVPGEWAAAVRQVNLLRPDFVICVGDLIEGYTEDPQALAAQWEEFEALTSKFQAPFFYCCGNHDVTNEMMLKTYVQRHGVEGKSYYSFDYRRGHFVVLNSNWAMQSEEFAKEQFDWLAKDLAAAKAAEHVFVFYHHPLWSNEKLWPALRGLLDADRTTIFNGHWHEFSHGVQDGIATYVLGATGAGFGVQNRELGAFRMFAHVRVDEGEPTIAALPLHEVLPGDYVSRTFLEDFDKLAPPSVALAISREGGPYTFVQRNPLDRPVKVALSWDAPGWNIKPDRAELAVKPGASASAGFSLAPAGASLSRPTLTATYELDNDKGRRVTTKHLYRLGLYATMDIARVKHIKIDGKLDDWAAGKGMLINTKGNIFKGVEDWSGRGDGSCVIRAAHDGQRLYVAVDVTDEEIFTGDENAWRNDAIEFFWDSRPADKQTGQHGEGTGQVILAVPAEGTQPAPYWNMGKRAVPQNLLAACARRKGGYVYELSIPLGELGVKGPVSVGRAIHLEIQLDDRDGEVLTHMTTSGLPESYRNTGGYARCRLK